MEPIRSRAGSSTATFKSRKKLGLTNFTFITWLPGACKIKWCKSKTLPGSRQTLHSSNVSLHSSKFDTDPVPAFYFEEWLERSDRHWCRSRNCPGFDPNILRHSVIWGAADEALLNKVQREEKKSENSPFFYFDADPKPTFFTFGSDKVVRTQLRGLARLPLCCNNF